MCAEIDYSHTAAAAAQGELGDAAPLAEISCVSCVLFRQATIQSGKERWMEGGKETRQLPVNTPSNLLEPVAAGFSF